MRPIHKRNFGQDGIKVQFHNGTALTEGYILRQVGTRSYMVTDGNIVKKVQLASTLESAQIISGITQTSDYSQVMGLATKWYDTSRSWCSFTFGV